MRVVTMEDVAAIVKAQHDANRYRARPVVVQSKELRCDECQTDQSKVIRLTSWHNEGFDICAACIARAGEMIREEGE